MAFDPLSWAIGYALKKGLDRLLTHKSLAASHRERTTPLKIFVSSTTKDLARGTQV
jgi:hypothetical protein